MQKETRYVVRPCFYICIIANAYVVTQIRALLLFEVRWLVSAYILPGCSNILRFDWKGGEGHDH